VIAANIGGSDGWRMALTAASVAAILYGLFYYTRVSDTPKGSTYCKPKKMGAMGAMEVTSSADLLLYMVMNIPLFLALALLAWKLSPAEMGLIGDRAAYLIYATLTALNLLQVMMRNTSTAFCMRSGQASASTAPTFSR